MKTEELEQAIENYYYDISKYPDGEKEGYILGLLTDFKTDLCKRQRENCYKNFLNERKAISIEGKDAILNAPEPE